MAGELMSERSGNVTTAILIPIGTSLAINWGVK
jgi:hypothetical protein